MPKIQVTTKKKTGQVSYQLYLPKDIMQQFAAQHGDLLTLKSAVGNEITFTFRRSQEVKDENIRLAQERVDRMKQ